MGIQFRAYRGSKHQRANPIPDWSRYLAFEDEDTGEWYQAELIRDVELSWSYAGLWVLKKALPGGGAAQSLVDELIQEGRQIPSASFDGLIEALRAAQELIPESEDTVFDGKERCIQLLELFELARDRGAEGVCIS